MRKPSTDRSSPANTMPSAGQAPAATSASVPSPLSVRQALDANPSLSTLAERMRRSRACLQASLPALPEALREHVNAGPYDDQGWTLIAANASVAAKLRQCLPSVHEALLAAGLGEPKLRVHVSTR